MRVLVLGLVCLAARAGADTTAPAPDAGAQAAQIAGEGGEELGHPTGVPSACVELRTSRGATSRLELHYDARGRLILKDEDVRKGRAGMRTRYGYDSAGRLLTLEGEYNAPSTVAWRYRYAYAPRREVETWYWEPRHKLFGRVVTQRNAEHLMVAKEWDTDGDGRLEKITRYRYEGTRLVEEWTETPGGVAYEWVRYFYDRAGRRLSAEGSQDTKTPLWREEYFYDAANRVIGKRQSAASNPALVFIETEYRYDHCD
jgi:hypothetical protein